MRYKYELYFHFKIRYSCHDQGCKNEMIWAFHKGGWSSCTYTIPIWSILESQSRSV